MAKRSSGLPQTRKVQVVDAARANFTTELALAGRAAATPAPAIAVAHDLPALDLVTIALAVDARHLGAVGAAIAARAARGCGDALVHRATAVAIAAIVIAMAVTPVAIAVAVTIVAAVARRRQDCGEAAEHDGAGDDLARADTVVVITIARHRGGAADQHRAGGGRADRGLGPRRFHRPSHVRSPSLAATRDRKSTRLNSSHSCAARQPSSARHKLISHYTFNHH